MTQIQLSDAQAVILSTACARENGAVFPVTASLKGGAVGNVCKSLLKQGLIEEIAATDLDTVGRHDEERGPITLRATLLAYRTLGITDEQTDPPPPGRNADRPGPAPEGHQAGNVDRHAAGARRRDHRRDHGRDRLAVAHGARCNGRCEIGRASCRERADAAGMAGEV